jgi:hypothetical protein
MVQQLAHGNEGHGKNLRSDWKPARAAASAHVRPKRPNNPETTLKLPRFYGLTIVQIRDFR